MRVLFLSPQPFFRVRGTPINIRNVVGALGEAGHEVDLLCYPFGEEVSLPNVRVLRSPGVPGIRDVKVGPSAAKIPLDLLMAFKTFWLLARGRYDVVHAVEESAFFGAFFLRWFFRKPAFIYDMDSCISDQLEYTGKLRGESLLGGPALRWVEWLERRAIARSNFVLTVCRSLSDVVRGMAPDARIVQIEDAPLEDEFVADAAGAAALEAEFGPGPFVVYTGNLESYQGIDLLVRAGALVTEPCTFLLAGGRPDQITELRSLAAELGAAERFHFAGSRPIAEMPAFYTVADLLVSPRTQGGNTALKIYTYMQTGKAIVATDLDTHTQVLDPSSAFLAAAEPIAYAAALDAALRDRADAAARGTEARRLVMEQYSLPMFKKRVVEAYQSLP